MNQFKNLSIGFIGLGLIGGSIAKSIRRIFPTYEILGFDLNKEALLHAQKENTITKIANSTDGLENCDYIFLCAPVHYNISYLPKLKKIIKPSCILTDVGSVKSDIYHAISQYNLDDQFIGGHPMVGSEQSGYTAANDRLIENAYYFVTPSATISKDKILKFNTFLESLNAIPILFSPEEHDNIVAYISHIPHIVAASLVNLVAEKDSDEIMLRHLVAGGFKDITRIASSNPLIWEHILLSNSHNIINGLQNYITNLEDIISAIRTKNSEKIYSYFDSARIYRNSIPEHTPSVIRMYYDIYVNVPDESNALANVVTHIGKHHLNIKNISITNNREDHEGVLRISFYDQESSSTALHLLKSLNYQVYCRS